MRCCLSIITLLAGLLAAGQAVAADIQAGRNRAAVCSACHGYNGISANDEWPNLAGQKTGYLIKQMQAFRDGTRQDPIMNGMLKGFSNSDIEDVAAYYNSLSPQ